MGDKKILCIVPDDTQFGVSAIPFLKTLLSRLKGTVPAVHYARVSSVKSGEFALSEYASVIACGEAARTFPQAKKVISPMSTKPGDFIIGVLEEVLALQGESDPHMVIHRLLLDFLMGQHNQWCKRFYHTEIKEDV